MLAGTYNGEEVSLSKMFEAVGAYKAGMIDACKLDECEKGVCPGCGSCAGMYTANSMNCLCESLGIALPGNGTIPAVSNKRIMLAKHAGMAIMEMVRRNISARDIINERSIKNALACDMALGCSSNSVLHLLAIANEAGVPLNLELFNPRIRAFAVAIKEQEICSKGCQVTAQFLPNTTCGTADGNVFVFQRGHILFHPNVSFHSRPPDFFFIISYFKRNCNKNAKKKKKILKKC